MGHVVLQTAGDAAECTCGWSGGTFTLAGTRSIGQVIADHLNEA